MSAFITYAPNENGVLVHIDDVANGAKCACHCRKCGAPLHAKNAGDQREHHFAHSHGKECEGAYESVLHMLAKEILQETGRIMLPKSDNGQFPSGSVRIHNIEIEKLDEHYGIQPDAEGILDNGERILIEFYVSHKVDQKKRQIIVDNNLKCIEIDVKYEALNRDKLKKFLTNTDENRKWIIKTDLPSKSKNSSNRSTRNPMYDKIRDILKDIFDNGTIIIHPHNAAKSFDLRKLGYDVCEVNTKFQGFKSDLLLYRSQKDDKGHISINLRGRSRDEFIRVPDNLRIIDIVFKAVSSTEEGARRRLKDGNLIGDLGMHLEYVGFK
jgi:hypothetical protein